MRDFMCPTCAKSLVFENSVCLNCGSEVGFDLATKSMQLHNGEVQLCANLHIAQCNWLVPAGEPTLCRSCQLTRVRPPDNDASAIVEFGEAEQAKRRLLMEITELDLPVTDRIEDPNFGLAFDLLSSRDQQAMTGHQDGVITIDLAEGDDVHREQLRVAMAEPYRTMLGHFRHEVGHYFYPVLVTEPDEITAAVSLFGDPIAVDYQQSLDRHYEQGPPTGWESSYVSSYATMHPSEDWAETFAHYLHIRDTLDTAAAFAMAPASAAFTAPAATDAAFERIIAEWFPLCWSLNMLNRSMGHADLYPFVLPEPVLEKLRFVHSVVTNHGGRNKSNPVA